MGDGVFIEIVLFLTKKKQKKKFKKTEKKNSNQNLNHTPFIPLMTLPSQKLRVITDTGPVNVVCFNSVRDVSYCEYVNERVEVSPLSDCPHPGSGEYFMSGGASRELALRSTASGKTIKTYQGHSHEILDIVWYVWIGIVCCDDDDGDDDDAVMVMTIMMTTTMTMMMMLL